MVVMHPISWSWGGGARGGTVAETNDQGEITIEQKCGNMIKKNASSDNLAVHVERSGNDVVRRASEPTVETRAVENQSKEDSDGSHRRSKGKIESQEGLETNANGDGRDRRG
ncbi:hypothetical protein F4824DRAFT_498479 [Ustulina deusta]|nr:hypothetical protein F4824DRAFT_498479 [Ustulina deusta]